LQRRSAPKGVSAFYKQIMALRRGSLALRRGTLEWVKNSAEARVVTFVRRAGNEEVLVAINFSSLPFVGAAGGREVSLDAWGYRIYNR
jgi:glycosidase